MMAGKGLVQFVVSGRFIVLLLLAGGFLAAGLWLYTHQPIPQTPPYYVNRVATALRPCFQCVDSESKLRAQQAWKFGKTIEIQTDERWWFAPVEDRPAAVKVDGVPMLAVHPAVHNDKPWFGFDQHRVYFVVFQDLDPRFTIEHPTPPPAPAVPAPEPPVSATASTSQGGTEQPTPAPADKLP